MAILELITLHRPFEHRKNEVAVIKDVVVNKAHPPRPANSPFLSDQLWSLMECSWSSDPYERPSISRTSQLLMVESSKLHSGTPIVRSLALPGSVNLPKRSGIDVEMY